MLQKAHDNLVGFFVSNPLAVVAIFAFLVTFYGNWQRGKELTIVCKQIKFPAVINDKPKNDLERAIKICSDRLSD